jgi:4,5-DOPA dioxygenase extradiol
MPMQPSLFISHGSPMMLVQDGELRQFLGSLGDSLNAAFGRPDAILIASAHWMTPRPAVGGAEALETIHDFYGFPEAMYEFTYTPPGAPGLAERAGAALAEAGIEPEHDRTRGLDHGAWLPLRYMYPGADIPVAQISVQPHLGPAHHLGLGAALEDMRAANILVIGSGNLTHNLGEMGRGRGDDAPAPWAMEFAEWVSAALDEGRLAELVNYLSHAPNGRRAHTTDEHFLPLFLAMGAGGEGIRPARIHTSYTGGAVCNDCYQFG